MLREGLPSDVEWDCRIVACGNPGLGRFNAGGCAHGRCVEEGGLFARLRGEIEQKAKSVSMSINLNIGMRIVNNCGKLGSILLGRIPELNCIGHSI